MKILLSGLNGYMGKEVVKLSNENISIVAGVDINCNNANDIPCFKTFDEVNVDYDVILDFSHHLVTKSLTEFAVRTKSPLVIATTGQTEEEKDAILKASNIIPVFYAANYSLGVALLIDLAKKAALTLKDAEIEIIEKHHNRKVDAPSGTALMIANGIKEVRPELTTRCGRSGLCKREKNEIGISSIRLGNIVGEHEVLISTGNESISLKHEAYNRGLFAQGALKACSYIINKSAGLYSMKDLIGD